MSNDLDIKGLNDLCRYLFARVWDAQIEIETLVQLLQAHEVFSQEEYEVLKAKNKRDWNDSMRATLLRSADASQSEAIRRFLEGYEGPTQ